MFEFQWDQVGDRDFQESWTDTAEHFSELQDLVDSGVCRFETPVRADIVARGLAGLVEVTGRVSTTVVMGCSRCLDEYRLEINAPFRLTFSRDLEQLADVTETSGGEDETDEGLELDAEALGLVPVSGDVVALRSLVAEQVVLELPARALCSEACKGLCTHCGRNLNREKCNCSEPVFDTRFAELAKLKIDNKSGE
ncbi:MAG: DUF177 domain-containing protein [Geothermobacteraceae bacterium]